MNNKKIIAFVLVLVLAVLMFGGCQQKQQTSETSKGNEKEKPKVTLWATGSDNVRTLFEKAIEVYNSKPDAKSTVELQFIMSGTGEQSLSDRIAAAKLAGQTNTDFDLLAENGSSLPNYVDKAGEDLLVKIDFSKIPNFKNVKMKSAFYPECVVPYRGTTVVMAYDSARLPNPPKTFDELVQWIKNNPGRFAYNSPGTGGAGAAFVDWMLYKDLPAEAKVSSDEKWVDQWASGWERLKEIHPYLYKSGGKVVYPNKNQGTLDLLINKEVDLIPAWADMVLDNLSKGILPDTVKIYQLDPPLSGTDVVFTIPSIGGNPEDTYDFINFMISPEGQKICLETIFAIPVIDSSLIDSDVKKMVADLDPSKFNIMSIGKLTDIRNKLWDENIATLP